jgi:hypothetical protein
VDGDRILRPLARGGVSLREHLSPTGRPPVAACGVADPHGTGPPLSTAPPPPPTLPLPMPPLHDMPCRGSLPSSHAASTASAWSRQAGLLVDTS